MVTFESTESQRQIIYSAGISSEDRTGRLYELIQITPSTDTPMPHQGAKIHRGRKQVERLRRGHHPGLGELIFHVINKIELLHSSKYQTR